MSGSAVSVERVSKRFRLYRERNQSLKIAILRGGRARYDEFWALRDVSFDVPEGTTFGLIGENGSGKSTMLKCIARILRPDSGGITSRGKISALLELGAGFHPELSGRENVYLNGAILGLSKRQLDERFDGIVDFAGIEAFIDAPVKNYSSGMYVRLGFSVAINVDPDILLIDEVLAVGDAEFQRKCTEKIADFRQQGKTIVLVSHSLPSVRALCDDVALLEHGKLRDVGPAGAIIDRYLAHAFSDRDATSDLVRWGSGEARVTSVVLLDGKGNEARHVRTGDAVTFRIFYKAAQRVCDVIIGLAVTSVEGVEITGPNTREAGLVAPVLDGEGYVDLTVPRLLLLPHSYAVTAAIYDFTGAHPIDHVQHAMRFEVEAGNPFEENGVVSLGGVWTGSPLRAIDPESRAG